MNEYFGPIDSYVRELKGNIKFLEKILTNNGVLFGIVGLVGSVGLLVAIALFFK
jgi:hypothetical protein